MPSTTVIARLFRRLIGITALASTVVAPVLAQDADVKQLQQQFTALYKQGDYQQAAALAAKAIAIAEKSLGPDHPDFATSLNNLAEVYRVQGLYAQAEPMHQRALAIKEKALGPDHPGVATSLNILAELYRTQGLYAQAEPLYLRALAIREKALRADDPEVANSLNNLAALYNTQGRYVQAEPLFQRALAIREKSLGPKDPAVATSLNNLAVLYRTQVLYAQAEPLFQRALSIREQALGPNHPSVANSLHNLAAVLVDQGQYVQAEPLHKRGLLIRERALGPDHPDVANSLNYLAELYRTQGQSAQAEPLYQRALAVREKALGPDHPAVATSLNNLALLYRSQGQYALAEPLYRRSLSIREKTLGAQHPDVATNLNNLGALFVDQGQYTQAEPLFKRALSIEEKSLGPDHPDVATSLNNLATLYVAQGQHAQAEPLFKRMLAIFEKTYGHQHPDVATSLNNLAALYIAQGQYRQALALSRRASAIYRQRIVAGGSSDAAIREASRNQSGFFSHLALLARNPDQEPGAAITDEAFQIIQLAQASGTASAIAKMAARFSRGDDELATLIKRKQDAADRVVKQETQLVTAASKPPAQRNTQNEQTLRDDILAANRDIERVDAELNRRFPQYQELTRPQPLSITQVRALLKPGEAMLVYALGTSSHAWVLKPDGASFIPLAVNAQDIATQVAHLRTQMEFDNQGRTQKVDLAALHALYQGLFAPAQAQLANVSHIMVVPTGPLQSLPLGMLVATPPPAIATDADYRQVDWLARRYALSVLPSVSSIQAFRQFAQGVRAQEPFAGFGDPSIGDQSGGVRGKSSKGTRIGIAGVFRSVVASADRTPSGASGAEIADVEMIRKVGSLPETAHELRVMAKVLKADNKSLWLRDAATETRIKHMDLSRYRTLAFATHGVMTGQLKGVGEPGLLLTPPQKGTVEDDGYLAAGEIARLKLNADWVILSACNTAASDGTPGAEGLSGMAKAFFYAGARSLLVSHWTVASEATVPLTTGMLQEYEANPNLGKAQAQRKAMLALMNTPDHPEYAHPLFWAPFVVVGEGGEGRR